jgi:hypothetical protein
MKRAVWTIFFRELLANEKPQYGICPSSGDSWCKLKISTGSGVAYVHKCSSRAAVMAGIKPVCRDLAGIDPLKKCVHGKTHDRNEYVSSVIWTRISKTLFVRPDTLKFGVCDTVLCFNNGAAKRNVLCVLGVRFGSNQ